MPLNSKSPDLSERAHAILMLSEAAKNLYEIGSLESASAIAAIAVSTATGDAAKLPDGAEKPNTQANSAPKIDGVYLRFKGVVL